MPNNDIHERLIVKHRVTHEKFAMKIVSHKADTTIREQMASELLAYQKMIKHNCSKEVLGLVDYFTDAKNSYLVT